MNKSLLWSAVTVCGLGAAVGVADPIEFDFKDPKGVNSVGFTLDSEVEPIRGFASGISGTITFDPAAPETTTGKLVIETRSLTTPNDGMTKTLYKDDWLDADANPEITFAFKKVESASKTGESTWELRVTGDMTIKGVTREMTVPVRAAFLEGALEKRQKGKGDLLALRSSFSVNRKDFEIKQEYGPVVVAEEIQITAQIIGLHPTE